MTGRWTLGVLIGLPVAGVIVLACLAALAYGILYVRSDGWGDHWGWSSGKICAVWAPVALVVVLTLTGWLSWPWQADYHRYEPTTGVVASISDRLVSAGDGMEQKFVVTFEGGPQEYGCVDTRCSLIEIGDTVTLMCIHDWSYSSTDGYNCGWGERRAAS